MKPRVAFQVPNTLTGEGNLSVDLTFESMDDFSPGAIANKVDALKKLLDARTELSNLLSYMDGKTGAEELIARVLKDPALLQSLASAPKPAGDDAGEVTPARLAQSTTSQDTHLFFAKTKEQAMAQSESTPEAAAAGQTLESSDFGALLLKEFKPKTDQSRRPSRTRSRPWLPRPWKARR